MKPKAIGPRPSEMVHVAAPELASNLEQSIRVMDHIQSGLRQLAFGLARVIPSEHRTPGAEAHLAALHEDEARYHEREAAWLRKQNKIIDVRSSSDSGGASATRPSRGRSSGSARSSKGKSSGRSPSTYPDQGPAAG